MIHHRCKRIRLKKSDSEKTIIKNRADLISIDNVAELPEASFISAARSGHVLISSFSKFIILKGSVIIAEAWFAIPSACRMLSISVLDNILHLHLIVAQNNLISYCFDLISKSLQNDNIGSRKLLSLASVESISSYELQLLFIGKNSDNSPIILLETGLKGALKFCEVVQQLYKTVGFVPRHLQHKSKVDLDGAEKDVLLCRDISLSEAVVKLREGVEFFNHELKERQELLGILNPNGPGGFVATSTVECLQHNYHALKRIDEYLSFNEANGFIKNKEHIKVFTLLNEAHIEHAFGRNFQSQTNEHAQMDEYLYKKNKIEMERILKICDTPFFFEAREKSYSEAPDGSSRVDVFELLKLLEQPTKPLRSIRESKLKADKEVVRITRSMTHGMRSKANRAIHKPSAFYAPTLITYNENSPTDHMEPSDDINDTNDNIDGLHIGFTTLSDGITMVEKDDWVAFNFGSKLLIGIYMKSIGHESIIDSTIILGRNIFGWPCCCEHKDYDYPIIACEEKKCRDISYINTNKIICRFNCPVLTRQGFKIPITIMEKYKL